MTLEGPDWKFATANKAVIELFQLVNREEFLKMAPWKLSPPRQPDGRNSEEKAREMMNTALEKGSNFFEWIHQRSDGENFYATVLLNRIDLEDRSFVLAVVRDVTETKISRMQLEESENRYRGLFEKSTDPNLLIENMKFIDCNAATLKFMNYKSKDDIIGKFPWEISPEYQSDGTLSIEKAKTVLKKATKKSYARFEWLHLNAEGNELWVDVSLTHIKVKGKDIIYTVWRDITEKEKARTALSESRQRLEMAMNGAKLGLWDIDFITGIVYRSERWSTMLGYKPGEIPDTNKAWLNLIHPEDKNTILYLRGLGKNQKDKYFQSEQRLKCKDGSYKWILSWGQIVERDENGHPLRAVGIHMDIDESKKAEQNLISTMSRLQATLEATADSILVVDLEGRIVDYNDKFIELWGISSDILPEGKKKDLVSPENMGFAIKHIIGQLVNPAGFIAKVQELYHNPNAESFDILHFKDGRIIERYSKPQSLDGVPVGRVWSFRDITDQKITEKMIKRSELLNRTVIEGSPIGISVRDTTGTLLLCNKAWQKLWGLTNAEIAAYKKPREKLLFNQKDEYLGSSINEIKRVYTQGGSYEIPELKLKEIHKFKAEWISQYFYAIMNENNQVDRVVILTNDITQKKKAQLELIQYRDHLEELVKERTSELEKKNMDLKKYNKLFAGREFRIKELRNKLAELEAKLKDHD